MIASDVTEAGRAALRLVYDELVEVDYLEGKVAGHGGNRFKSMYHHWLPKCFTKLHAFEMTQYDKVTSTFSFAFSCEQEEFVNLILEMLCNFEDLPAGRRYGVFGEPR